MTYSLKYPITDKNLPEAAEEMKQIKELKNQIDDLKTKIRLKYEASSLFNFVSGFSYKPQKGSYDSPLRESNGNFFVTFNDCDLNKDFVAAIPAYTTPPFAYIGEKTLNMLLSGKLLTDEEKREIVKKLKVIGDEQPSRESGQ